MQGAQPATTFAGTMAANPYLADGRATPLIADASPLSSQGWGLRDGADAFGVMKPEVNAGDFFLGPDPAIPDTAKGALFLVESWAGGDALEGWNYLVLVNLQPIAARGGLGIPDLERPFHLAPLRESGFRFDPIFAPGGGAPLPREITLAPNTDRNGGVYAVLVPDGASIVNSFISNTRPYYGITLMLTGPGHGFNPFFLETVPEPSSILLFFVSTAGLLVLRQCRLRG